MLIYKITNLTNGKSYIGQTVSSLKERWRHHILKSSRCLSLKAAIEKYGIENFKIEEIDGANSQDELNYKEWLWIHKANSLSPNGYNLRDGGGSKGSWSEEIKAKISRSNTGKKFSEERKLEMSRVRKGQIPPNKGVKLTPEQKANKVIVNRKKIICVNNGVEYESASAAARALNLKVASICKVAKKQRNNVHGYKFVYIGA